MPTCSARNCSYVHKNKSSGKTIHRFPFSRPDVLAKWIANLKRGEGWYPSKYSVLCSQHFEKSSYEYEYSSSSHNRLKKDAVPTIFNFPPCVIKEFAEASHQLKFNSGHTTETNNADSSPVKREIILEEALVAANLENQESTETCNQSKLNSTETNNPDSSPDKRNNILEQALAAENKESTETSNHLKLHSRHTTEFNNPDSNLDKRNSILEKALADAKLKNKILRNRLKIKQQNIRRLKKTNESFKIRIACLKKTLEHKNLCRLEKTNDSFKIRINHLRKELKLKQQRIYRLKRRTILSRYSQMKELVSFKIQSKDTSIKKELVDR